MAADPLRTRARDVLGRCGSEGAPWLAGRFAGLAAPQDCAEIAPGNSVASLKKAK